MQMGFALRPITPDIPCRLAGYAAVRPAEGVSDELYARALAISGAGGAIVILQLDVLCVDELFISMVEARLKETGIKRDQLLVFCSHTHSSFGGIFDVSDNLSEQLVELFGEANPGLLEMLTEASAQAITEAIGNRREAGVRILNDTITGVATNRHSPEEPCDRDILVIDFLRDHGKRVLLYNLSCHPTVLDKNNKLLSADFTGYAGRYLGNHCDMSVFINGSAGDMSTRFTRRESSFGECGRIGGIIGEKVLEMLSAEQQHATLENASLTYHTLSLKQAVIDDPGEAERKLRSAEENLREVMAGTDDPSLIRKAQSYVEGASINLMKSKGSQTGRLSEVSVRVGILCLNGRKIVCSPFELFSTLALLLKSRTQAEMFGYSNAYQGYLADAKAYESMEYEALFSDFAAGQGEVYIEKVLKLIR